MAYTIIGAADFCDFFGRLFWHSLHFNMKKLLSFGVAALMWILWGARLALANDVLVPAGAVWSFLDDGTDQGSGWKEAGFSGSGWGQGAAELGYGDGDEVTVVSFGGVPTNRVVTTYFRTTFMVADPSVYDALTIKLLRDDGAVVFLNGVEIRRDNLPAGPIGFTTLASTALGVPSEATFYETVHAASLLVEGLNTLAVEVHQANVTSSDVSFNLELTGVNTASVTRGPYLQMATPTGVMVRWRTDLPTLGRVVYAPSGGGLGGEVLESAVATDHAVFLSGLQSGTSYAYQVGDASSVFSGEPDGSFTTAPVVGTIQPTRIWVLGDSGTGNAGAAAVRDAYTAFPGSDRTDVWLMLGDNAYNSGTDIEYQSAVFNMYPNFLRRTALWSTIGNHDSGQSTSTTATFPYLDIFSLPANAEAGGVASGTEKYYSFDHANIHFICLDSMTTSRLTTGVMAEWLRQDLEATSQDWIIAFWHHPPYTKGSHDSDVEPQLIQMRENFLPLLEAGGVDLVLAGHSHSYERSYLLNGHYGLSATLAAPMKIDGGNGRADGDGIYEKPGGNAAQQGAVYVTAGSSGQVSGGALNHPAMYASFSELGSLVIDIDGPRLDARFLRETGVVRDYFTLTKSVPNQPPTVGLTHPVEGAVFAALTPIVVSATAVDGDGGIVQVDFYAGDVAIGSDTSAPFEVTWSDATAGTHVLTAAATDTLGDTVTSAPVTIFVQIPVPAVPSGVTATAGNGSVVLAWQAAPTAEAYRLYRATTLDGQFLAVAQGLTVTGYTDTAVSNGTPYFYKVTAVNAGGESGFSTVVSATPVAPLTIPVAPSLLTAVGGNAQVALSWQGSATAASYTVYRSRTATGSTTVVASQVAATTFVDGTVANGTRYFYRVRAVNAAGQSPYSNQVSATPNAPLVLPAAPTGLVATAVSSTRINLTWTDASTNETGFLVERRRGSGAWSQIARTQAGVVSFSSTGLSPSTAYSYRLRSTNAAGSSAYSNTAVAVTLPR